MLVNQPITLLKLSSYSERNNTLVKLSIKLFAYVNWYNNKLIHGSLGYLTPSGYKQIKKS